MSTAVEAQQPAAPSLQTKSGLVMPITRIKEDAKRASGCDQMAADAAVAIAAVMEFFIEEINRRAQTQRRKGHSSIAPEVVESVVTSDPDFASILGENPVFITGAKKVSSRKTKSEEGEEAKEPKKKRKVAKEEEEGEKKKEDQ